MIVSDDLHARTDDKSADENREIDAGQPVVDGNRITAVRSRAPLPENSSASGGVFANSDNNNVTSSTTAQPRSSDETEKSTSTSADPVFSTEKSFAGSSLPSESVEYKQRRDRQYQHGLTTLLRAVILFGGLLVAWLFLNIFVWN